MTTKSYGFFFLNHSAHIYHAISIAFELSKINGRNVKIFTSTKRNFQLIKEVAEKYYPNHKAEIVLLTPSFFYRASRFLKRREFPGFKAVFSQNLKALKKVDIYISPTDDILGLKRDFYFKNKVFIKTLHGVGELGSDFEKTIMHFDYMLLGGEKLKQYFENKKSDYENCKTQGVVIGYPKQELCSKFIYPASLETEYTKALLYAPHFNENYNSWNKFGESLVNWAKTNQEYKLIIAPHILMSKREKNVISKLCKGIPNIKVDIKPESKELINMSYLNQADIFIGDKTSQIYEFLLTPRPCVFFNTRKTAWENSNDANYDAWKLGQVICEASQIDSAIKSAETNHHQYKKLQIEAVKERISQHDEGPSLRAAHFLASL